MNVESAVVAFEEALGQQAALGGDVVEETAGALLGAVRPAVERLALAMAEEAAAEVTAQLVDSTVRVVVEGGAPSLVVDRVGEDEHIAIKEDLEARLTLRLPASLKSDLEDVAGDVGDSVNAHVVETLAKALHRHRRVSGRRFSGTIET